MKNTITFFLIFASTLLNAQWKEINEGLDGGYITSIAKNYKNEIFISTYGGGIIYSSNQGANWIERNKGLNGLTSNNIFVYDDTLIANTGNVINYSFDQGESWYFSSTNLDNSLIFSLIKNNKFFTITSQEFVVSYDTCKNWIKKGPSLTGYKIYKALYFNNEFLLLTDLGIYSSVDFGDTWILKPFELKIKSVGFFKIIDNIYFFSDGAKLYYSSNNGENWSKIDIGLYTLTNIEKVEDNYLISSYEGNFILSNNLSNYEKKSGFYYYQSINASIKIDSSYYFCTGQGIYKSTDNCKTWTQNNCGLNSVNTSKIIIDKDDVYCITLGGEFFKRIFQDKIWKIFDLDTLRGLSDIITLGNRCFFPTLTGIIVKDTIGNYIETKKFDGYYVTNIIQKSKKLFVVTSNGKLYSSIDIGENWKLLSGFLENLQRVGSIGIINDNIYMKISDFSNNSIFYLISKNLGENWEKDTTLTNIYMYNSYHANIFDHNFYASINNNGYSVNISYDYGRTWTKKPILKKPPLANPIYLFGTKNYIFTATNKGVYLSLDQGDNWIEVNDGLKNLNTTIIKACGDEIYLGTTNGVYTAKLSDFGLSGINEPTTENQNYLYPYPAYPVPSNTGFVKSLIYWDTSIDIDKAKITITNVTGEIINTDHKLSIEKNNNFNGNLIWDCRNMPSGAYFIKIEHGSASVTLKVMVD